MCTVTFVPGLAGGGYVLTTNRDESHRRGQALPPRARPVGSRSVLAPTDADAGGTWVAVDEGGAAICLLNGDGPPAAPPDPRAPSRGLLVWELMERPAPGDVEAWLRRHAAEGALRYRPFKLLVVEPGRADTPARALRARWDGRRLDFSRQEGPAVAVSSTFRREDVAARRLAAWDRFLTERGDRAGDWRPALAAFHAGHAPGAADGDAYSICMHRDDARTVSCSMVHVDGGEVTLDYRAGWPCEGGPLVSATLARR